MFDIDGMLRKQLRDTLDARQTLIFPEGDDPRIVTAASRLLELAHVVLVGSAERARDSIARGDASLECSESRFFASVRFVDPHTEPLAETLGVRLQRLSRGTRWELSRADAAQRVREQEALRDGALRVLRGLEPARTYPMVDPMVDPSRAIAEEGSDGSGDPRGGLEDRSSCGEPAE